MVFVRLLMPDPKVSDTEPRASSGTHRLWWIPTGALWMMTSFLVFGCACGSELVNVFSAGTDGYFCFRIPALARAPNGTLLAFAEGRNTGPDCHDEGSVDIVMKASRDNGASWGPLRRIRHAVVSWNPSKNLTVGNPAPLVLGGTVYLPFATDTHWLGLLQSSDGGTTWSNPHNITTQGPQYPFNFTSLTSGPGSSIALASNRMLVPAHGRWGNTGIEATLVFWSDNAGANWSHVIAVPPDAAVGASEACLAAMPWVGPGAVLLTSRAQAKPGCKVAARSDDGGQTWSKPWQIISESPVQGSLVALPHFPGGPALLQSDTFGTARIPRANLTLHLSLDDGRTFESVLVVWPNASAYSSLLAPAPVSSKYESPPAVQILFERGAALTDPYWQHISFREFVIPAHRRVRSDEYTK